MLSSTQLLGIKVTTSDKKDIISSIENYLLQKKSSSPLQIFSINPEIVITAQKNAEFTKILNSGDINLPDGVGILWALKYVSSIMYHVSRIAGIDLMEDLIKLAQKKGYPVAFIGGRDNTAQKSLEVLQKKYPGLTGWSQEPPELTVKSYELLVKNNQSDIHNSSFINHKSSQMNENYFKQLVLKIKKNNTKLVFVGLGAPKQEYFINCIKYQVSSIKSNVSSVMYQASGKKQLHDTLTHDTLTQNNLTHDTPFMLMSVGGAFDTISGKLQRAPKLLQFLNLEWLWRLILEPWRFKRQLNLLKFIYLVVKGRFVLK